MRCSAGAALALVLTACADVSVPFLPAPPAAGEPVALPFAVTRPDGPGPFPAVVILHDCSGLGPRSSGAPARWRNELVAHGYVVVIPDSFTPRGHAGGVCTEPSATGRFKVAPARRTADAYAALDYARSLPYVDGNHVGVMGGSHGGTSTLATMAAAVSADEPLAAAKQHGFAAAVALYPACAYRMGAWRGNGAGVYKPVAPVLILVGEKDDWTPAEPCRQLAAAATAAGESVAIKVYPGANHSFDSRNPVRYVAERVNANAPGGRGATTGGDPVAWADSILEVEAFFGKYLKP